MWFLLFFRPCLLTLNTSVNQQSHSVTTIAMLGGEEREKCHIRANSYYGNWLACQLASSLPVPSQLHSAARKCFFHFFHSLAWLNFNQIPWAKHCPNTKEIAANKKHKVLDFLSWHSSRRHTLNKITAALAVLWVKHKWDSSCEWSGKACLRSWLFSNQSRGAI